MFIDDHLSACVCTKIGSWQSVHAGRESILDIRSKLLAMILLPGMPRLEKDIILDPWVQDYDKHHCFR